MNTHTKGRPTVVHTASRKALAILSDILEYRNLLWVLTKRNIKLRYRQTALGILWVVFQPLSTAVIFAVIFGRIAHLPSEGTPYFLFSFAGMLPWLLISQSIQRGSMSLIGEAHLITKVYFPRSLVPLSSIFAVLLDFMVALAATFILMLFYHFTPNWQLLTVPFFMFLALLFSMGLTLFFSAISVYYRDFIHVTPLLIQLWLYASPIAYSSTMISEKWRLLYCLNPLVGIIEGFRWALLGLSTFPTDAVMISLAAGLLFFSFGTIAFQKMERHFADVI